MREITQCERHRKFVVSNFYDKIWTDRSYWHTWQEVKSRQVCDVVQPKLSKLYGASYSEINCILAYFIPETNFHGETDNVDTCFHTCKSWLLKNQAFFAVCTLSETVPIALLTSKPEQSGRNKHLKVVWHLFPEQLNIIFLSKWYDCRNSNQDQQKVTKIHLRVMKWKCWHGLDIKSFCVLRLLVEPVHPLN